MYLKAVGALLVVFAAGIAQAQVGLNVDVEARVRAYFADTPVMIEIARCESKFRQYTDAGNTLYGGAGSKMVGVFQIHSGVHATHARSVLNYDITTLEGNLGYAKYLYQTEGTQPWMSSFPCWGSASNTAESSTQETVTNGDITANLSFGMVHPQVLRLQKKLNEKGFTIAAEGPGSPGQETEKFGFLTREAVKKFQCATINVCDGDEHTNGYGFVGARTRAALVGTSTAPVVSSPAPATTTTTTTPDQQAEIARLQAQIAELTKVLAELLATKR